MGGSKKYSRPNRGTMNNSDRMIIITLLVVISDRALDTLDSLRSLLSSSPF